MAERTVELVLRCLASLNVSNYERDKVGYPVGDHRLFGVSRRLVPGPGGLPCGAITIESSPARSYPVSEAEASIRKVAMPPQRCGSVLVGVVGAQPVQMQQIGRAHV